MSQSPAEQISVRDSTNRLFRQELSHLNRLLNQGGSLSGNERNCAFLNLGKESGGGLEFATVSTITGFDFNDDGRAIGLTDWDGDGDVDVWVVNRTGPRIRYLSNQQSTPHHWLQVSLQGTSSNRDGVGAKVRVDFSQNGFNHNLFKWLRAGEGFLAQSSKRLHFGLGTRVQNVNLSIRWPSGHQDIFQDVSTNRCVKVIEGKSKPTVVRFNPQAIKSKAAMQSSQQPTTERAHVALTSRLATPPLRWVDLTGTEYEMKHDSKKYTLLNLWATWCVPCQKELSDLKHLAPSVSQRLRILALSVDGIDDPKRSGATHDLVQKQVAALKPTFQMGFISRQAAQRLQMMDDAIFSQRRTLPIPASFLISPSGKLCGIIQGPVQPEMLKTMLDQAHLTGKKRFDSALPFEGIWFQPHQQVTPVSLVAKMAAEKAYLDAAHYALDNAADIKSQAGFASTLERLSTKCAQINQTDLAIELDRVILKQEPNRLSTLNNLAWRLASHPTEAKRKTAESVRLAERAAKLSNYQVLPVLDTLATCLVADNQTDQAKAIYSQAFKIAKKKGDVERMHNIEKKLRTLNAGRSK